MRDEAAIDRAAGLLRGRRIAVLTGAGISTDSGIPAYRGAGARTRATPMTIQTYLSDEAARRRYWLGGTWDGRRSPPPSPMPATWHWPGWSARARSAA